MWDLGSPADAPFICEVRRDWAVGLNASSFIPSSTHSLVNSPFWQLSSCSFRYLLCSGLVSDKVCFGHAPAAFAEDVIARMSGLATLTCQAKLFAGAGFRGVDFVEVPFVAKKGDELTHEQ